MSLSFCKSVINYLGQSARVYIYSRSNDHSIIILKEIFYLEFLIHYITQPTNLKLASVMKGI